MLLPGVFHAVKGTAGDAEAGIEPAEAKDAGDDGVDGDEADDQGIDPVQRQIADEEQDDANKGAEKAVEGAGVFTHTVWLSSRAADIILDDNAADSIFTTRQHMQ